MKRNALLITAAGLWLASLGAAWHLGKQSAASDGGAHASRSGYAGTSAPQSGAATSGGRNSGGSTPGSSQPGKPLTVKQIIARTAAAMRGGAMMNPMGMMKAMAGLDEMPLSEIRAALAEVDSLTDPEQKMMLQMALLGKWAEADGRAAMKYAGEHPSGTGMMAQIGKMGVAAAWAEKDPEAVWKWYKDQDEKGDIGSGPMSEGNMVLVSLFSRMAADDPALAFKRLNELEDGQRMMALGGILSNAMIDDSKRSVILSEVEAMPDAEERNEARQMLLSQWAMMAPDQALEWVKTQPAAEQATLKEGVGSMLLMSDPKKGAALLLEGATDEQIPQRYTQIITTWAVSDANAAGAWLNAQPQGPHLDEARTSFVLSTSKRDPESAMAWAGTITDAEQRTNATGAAYHAWIKKDPTAAAKALNNSGLTAEQIQSVHDNPANPGIPAAPIVKEQ